MLPPEDQWPIGRGTPRVDGCDFFEVDCDETSTDEEKTWPIGKGVPRVDGFEWVTEDTVPAAEVVVRVELPAGASAAEAAAVRDQLNTAAEHIRAATGGRFPVRVEVPTPPA